MKFPYVQFQKKFSPIMPIKLRHKNKEWTEFKACVDSGASYSIFRSEIVDILGIELEKGHLKDQIEISSYMERGISI